MIGWPAALVNNIAKTPDGNLVVAGGFAGDVNLGDEVFSTIGHSNGAIFKIDPAGNLLWKRDLGSYSPNLFILVDMVVSNTGDIYVLWTESEEYMFHPTKSHVFKLTSTGNVVQYYEFPSQYLFLESMAVAPSGDLIILGTYTANNVMVGDNSLPTVPDHWFYSYKQNYALIKIDVNWDVSLLAAGDGTRYGYAQTEVAIDQSSGNIYVAGRKALTTPAEESLYYMSTMFLTKFSNVGAKQWEIIFDQYYTNGGVTGIFDIACDNHENVYITGAFGGTLNLNGAAGTTNTITSINHPAAFTAKFNGNGSNLWLKKVGSQYASEWGAALALDNEQNLWVGFNSLSRPQIENLVVDDTDQNVFVKYSASGDVMEVLSMPGYENEIRSIAVGNDNNVFFAGVLSTSVKLGSRYILNNMPWYANSFFGKISQIPSRLHLLATNAEGSHNQEIVVPIKANGFTDIIGAQFSITWDESVAAFLGVEQFGLTGMNASHFGLNDAVNGKIAMSWSCEDLSGVTLEGNSTLFALRFKLVGERGQSTYLTIGSQPVAIEIINESFQIASPSTSTWLIQIAQDPQVILLSGTVSYPNGRPIENVKLSIFQTGTTSSQIQSTPASGEFEFELELTGGIANIQLAPSKTNSPSPVNGIDVQDMAAIRRHLLRTELLPTPFQIIAADVDQSNSVSTLDILYVQALVLGIMNKFPHDKEWAFVSTTHNFPNPANPFPFPQTTELSLTHSAESSFFGIRYGDVNLSHDPLAGRTRSDQVIFEVGTPSTNGNEVTAPIRVYGFQNISAYQFTLSWNNDNYQFEGVNEINTGGAFGEAQSKNGILTALWDSPTGQSLTLPDGATLFELKLIAQSQGNQAPGTRIESEGKTPSKVFGSALEPLTFLSRAEHTETPNAGESQPFPNPFHVKVQSNVYLANAGAIDTYVTASDGRSIASFKTAGQKGHNLIEWDGTDAAGNMTPPGLYCIRICHGITMQTFKVLKN